MVTDVYDELIVPLFHRMSNLEKLDLSFTVCERKTFIDGNELKRNIFNHMWQLNTFTFNIRSLNEFHNEVNLLSNEDIQKTFKDFKDNQIISCVDYFPKKNKSRCHIYSYPYRLKHYNDITTNFPGGLFKCVREVSLFDERPFEHEFFLQIAQSFPLLNKLIVVNQKRQNDKQFRTLKSNNQVLSIIKYPHLTELDLISVHKDYVRQFLFDNKTCLPNTVYLRSDYRLVKKVTSNFQRNITRSNCAKLRCVYFSRKLEFPEHFKDYFPHSTIL
jgi:hypothetical protein